jgi:Ca2+-binding RTX toxin-like protein
MTIPVTVPGVASGKHGVGNSHSIQYSTITLQYNTEQNAGIAMQLLAQIYAAAADQTLEVRNGNESPTGFPEHPVKEFTIGDQGGQQNTGPTDGKDFRHYLGMVDAYTNKPATIVGAKDQANETVVAGGGLHFFTNGGSGTVISGQGGNVVTAPAKGDGNWTVIFDGGNNTVHASSGNFLIDDGSASVAGANQISFGSGSDTVVAWGHDSITGTSGDRPALVFGMNGADVSLSSPVSGNELIAGPGNVTLNGSQASGDNVYFAGLAAGSADSIVAGSGNNTLIAGHGSDTLGGGAGANLFQVDKSLAGGGSDFLVHWNSKDTLLLSGYGAATAPGGLPAGATTAVVGGSEVLTLADGTKITFVGVQHVPNSHIVGT